MAKSIKDRVRASFSSDDKDSLKYYLDSTIAASKSYADGMRRSATFMLILIAVFELLVEGVVKQVTIGPFVFSGITIILAFAPSAIAYFYYESCTQAVIFGIIVRAYIAVFEIWNDKAGENDLDLILLPPTPAFFPGSGFNRGAVSSTEGLLSGLGLVFRLPFIFGVPIFEAYAFYQLFNIRHTSSVLLWLNVFLTTGLLFMGFAAVSSYGGELNIQTS